MHSAFFSQILSGKKILLNTNKILGRDIFFFLCREFLLHFILFIYLILCGDIIVSSSEVFFWGCRILKKFIERFFSFEKYRWLIDGNQECFFFFLFVFSSRRWYHGSITRIEAEAVLRLLREGSYLVRNSESTKQDYSLSLK